MARSARTRANRRPKRPPRDGSPAPWTAGVAEREGDDQGACGGVLRRRTAAEHPGPSRWRCGRSDFAPSRMPGGVAGRRAAASQSRGRDRADAGAICRGFRRGAAHDGAGRVARRCRRLGSPVMRSAGELIVDRRMHASEIARFHRHVVCGPAVSDCDIWTGAIGADGYGRFYLTRAGSGLCVRPHRYALAIASAGGARRRARSARMRQPGVRQGR